MTKDDLSKVIAGKSGIDKITVAKTVDALNYYKIGVYKLFIVCNCIFYSCFYRKF